MSINMSLPSSKDNSYQDTHEQEEPQSEVLSPPYWQTTSPAPPRGQGRTRARTSSSLKAGQINLIDNTSDTSTAKACWARGARITDWTIVSGSLGKIDSYVVFNCVIETTNGSKINLAKRYSDFSTFHQNLCTTFPNSHGAIPALPAKSLYKFKDDFLAKRKAGLEYFLHAVVLNPEFSATPVLREFLFGRQS